MASNLAADEETLGDVGRREETCGEQFYGIGSAENQIAEKDGLLVRNQREC
jgi:hypothetical protein